MIVLLSDSVLLQREAVRAETIVRLFNGYGIVTSEEEIFEYLFDMDDVAALQLIRERFRRLIHEGLDYQLGNLSRCWNEIDIRLVKYAREFVLWLPRPSCILSPLAEKAFTTCLSKVALDSWLRTHIFTFNTDASEDHLVDSLLDIADAIRSDPRHCVVATHSSAQIRAARLAGMRAVGFLGGSASPTWQGGTLLSAGADEIVCDLHNLKRSIAIFQSYIRHSLSDSAEHFVESDTDELDESIHRTGFHSSYW